MFMQTHDHLQRAVTIPVEPQRILSLCPSITETLFALGLGDRVVGRTQFCIHPSDRISSVHTVGGTKQVDDDKIAALAPDLIIAEKEENTQDIVERLATRYPVYVVNVESIADAYTMIRDVGTITGTAEAANALVTRIQAKLHDLPRFDGKKAAYFIWRKPYMVVGKTTYIDAMLAHIGFTNPFAELDGRYPVVTVEQIQHMKPDIVLLSSEPYPFAEGHVLELQEHLPDTPIVLVDGEMFSWYGVRMLQAADYVSEWQKEIQLLLGGGTYDTIL